MTTRFSQARAKLADCQLHGAGTGAELLLVEGDSAQSSVLGVRDERFQAVLPLQGKPLNAWVANAAKVEQHLLFQQLALALGLAKPTAMSEAESAALRYERIVLLFDPDADGIHIGALMLLYFKRWLPALLSTGRVWMVRAPMFELVAADGTVHHAYNPTQCQHMNQALRAEAGAEAAKPLVQTMRGLGSIAPSVLRSLCVDPATRAAHAVDEREMQAVVEIFGGAGGN
jgi:DNA gyrase subunit B